LREPVGPGAFDLDKDTPAKEGAPGTDTVAKEGLDNHQEEEVEEPPELIIDGKMRFMLRFILMTMSR
jgi:hypothetical protein